MENNVKLTNNELALVVTALSVCAHEINNHKIALDEESKESLRGMAKLNERLLREYF